MSKKTMKSTAVPLMRYPSLPMWKGPAGKFARLVAMFAAKGIAYETVVRMMKDPVRARNAAELPRGMHPRIVATTAARRQSLICRPSLEKTKKKKKETGSRLTDEQGGPDGAAEVFVDSAEEAGERHSVVASKGPVGSRILEVVKNNTSCWARILHMCPSLTVRHVPMQHIKDETRRMNNSPKTAPLLDEPSALAVACR